MPETFIPDAYSFVQQMINETNDLYIKELATANKEKSGALEITKDIISTSANIVKAGLGISGTAEAITKDQRAWGNAY